MARMIKYELSLNIGVRKVQQVLSDEQFCEYEKRISDPRISVALKSARLD